MTRRLIAVTVAIALAAVGTAGILWYVISANDRAQQNLTDPVRVAVADKQIPAGTSGTVIREQKLVRYVQMPKGVVPQEDVLGDIGAEFDNLVVTANVEEGFMVLRPMFGERSQVTSGLPTPPGKMAVTVETGAPEQVAGYVRPGAEISVFATYKLLDAAGEETNITRTKLLLARVQVLAVGSNRGSTDGGATATGGSGGGDGALLITVAVSQTEAERLILAKNNGSLYLGLLTESTEVKPGPGVQNQDQGTSTPLFR
jgi:pilus assembly protein CpaB